MTSQRLDEAAANLRRLHAELTEAEKQREAAEAALTAANYTVRQAEGAKRKAEWALIEAAFEEPR